MTEPTEPQDAAPREGERIAKVIARAGLGSRREAEAWIDAGRVSVNGLAVESPAFNVTAKDRVEVDGRPLPARERTRLWLYHKPRGYVTTTHDPEGRETVFSVLPAGLPRVVTIGRLDINTEGLLLLTNDGGLARVLELPDTGWLRRYRVRAFGRVTQEALDALKDGLTIDGFAYGAIEAEVERQQGDNVWLRFGLREGKNREVKRVAEHLGLGVNRLIRISFGPFQLGQLGEGEAEEVRTRTLADQLGKRLAEEAGCDFETPTAERSEDAPRMTGGRGAGRAAERRPDPAARLSDPSQRVGRRAPIARPRDMAAPASAAPADERPAKIKRDGPIEDRRGRKVKVERVSRAANEPAPKRVHKRDAAAAERFGADGRGERKGARGAGPGRSVAKPGDDRRSPPRDGERAASFRPRPERGAEDRPRAGGFARKETGFDRDAPRAAPRPAGATPAGERHEPRWPSADEGGRGPRRREDARPTGDRPDRPARPASPKRPSRPGERPERDAARPARRDGPAGPRRREDARADRPATGRAPRTDGDRPRRDRPPGDRPQAARPERRERPATAAGVTARPERPAGERPPRREWKDRPAGAAVAARPARPAGERPERREWKERPEGARPAGAARPERPAGERAPRRDVKDRPAARTRDEKPGGERPARREWKDRPPRRTEAAEGARPAGAGAGRPAVKPRGTGGPKGGKPGGSKPGSGFKPRGPGGGQGGGRGRPGGADRRR